MFLPEIRNILGWSVTSLALMVSVAEFNAVLTMIISLLSVGFLMTKWYFLIKNKGK